MENAHTPLFNRISRKFRTSALAAGVLATPLLLAGCMTTNPATGGQDFTPFMSPSKAAQVGAQEHPKILKQHGGTVSDPDITGYVAVVGGQLAAVSETPDEPFTFTVLNSPVVNAFALPGGYVYVTRGIMSLFNSESELASVMGHEIGHVTARHSAKRYNQQIFAGLGAALLGAVIKSPEVGEALGYGSQIYLKSYSRSNEYEADQLGVRYATRAGHNPYAAADMLRALEAHSQLQDLIANRAGQQRLPEFFSTHPNTADRVTEALEAAGKTGLAPDSRNRNRDRYLDAIDGMIYGDDPAQGLIKGQSFWHGPLRLNFTMPDNYQMINAAEALYAQGTGPAEGAFVIFAGESLKGRNMMEFTAQVWNSFVKEVPLQGLEEFSVNGLSAVAGHNVTRVQNVDTQVEIVTIHHSADQAYYFLNLTPVSKLNGLTDDLRHMIQSFRRLSPEEAQQVKGRVIRIVTVRQGDSMESLAGRMAFDDYRQERFMTLNGFTPETRLTSGQRVKLVVFDD